MVMAQQTVTVKFTGRTVMGEYFPFDVVTVTNVDRGWSQTLLYPDTVLVLKNSIGIDEHGTKDFRLGEAYPNPFNDETRVPIELTEATVVQLQVVRSDGSVAATRNLHLEAGTHGVTVRLANAGMAFLCVTTPQGRSVAKLVSTSKGGENQIKVETVSTVFVKGDKATCSDASGYFAEGDMMQYEGVSLYEGGVVHSTVVKQRQFSDETVKLKFDNTNMVNGALGGLFSVSDNRQVQFSQGNLQYVKSSDKWLFMEHQYDLIEEDGQDVGEDYGRQDVVSFFGWGTSGYDCGNVHFKPWETAMGDESIAAQYGPFGEFDLTGSYADCDWGYYNPISNGGDKPQLWRTMTYNEWTYVFDKRQASTVNGVDNARYVKAMIANTMGVILFPDHYIHPEGVQQPSGINDIDDWGTLFSLEEWTLMEQAGCVFLPAAGYRMGTSVEGVGSYGTYATATHYDNIAAYSIDFNLSSNNLWVYDYKTMRCFGTSVRLVRDAGPAPAATLPTVITTWVANVTQTFADCAGEVIDDGGAPVTARGFCWNTVGLPTLADSHTLDGSGMGSYTSQMTGLTPGQTYYVRAYVTNGVGTAYGNEVVFTTLVAGN